MKKGKNTKVATKVEIKPTVLGRKAAEYKRLTDANVPTDRIEARMLEDAQMMGITVDDFKSRLAELKNKSTTGKRAELKEKKSAVQEAHLKVCSFLNEIVTTGNTDTAEMQTALVELGEKAQDWVLMTNPKPDEGSGKILFTINDSGWGDGTNRQNQYSDRPQMVGKSGKIVPHPFVIRGQA